MACFSHGMETDIVRGFFVAISVFCSLSNSVLLADEGEAYLLRYKLAPGEQLHYEVTHVAKTQTRINGTEDVTQVHTVSKRHWDVAESDSQTFKFDHIIDSVQMTQQQGDQDELRWTSSDDGEVPAMFKIVAEQIGKSISTVTASVRGTEIDRVNNGATKASLGMGSLTMELPEKPIRIDESWSVAREVKTRTDDGLVKPIKIRELYTLEKVQTGVATISVRSEPLTPIREQSVKAQVVQQLSNGEIRFDVDNGRMLDKQLDWDEEVVGFQGPSSMMEYRARMSEKLIDSVQRTARLEK